jgi:hypothetical protein
MPLNDGLEEKEFNDFSMSEAPHLLTIIEQLLDFLHNLWVLLFPQRKLLRKPRFSVRIVNVFESPKPSVSIHVTGSPCALKSAKNTFYESVGQTIYIKPALGMDVERTHGISHGILPNGDIHIHVVNILNVLSLFEIPFPILQNSSAIPLRFLNAHFGTNQTV